MGFFLLSTLSYLLGSILFGVLIAKVAGLGDLTQKGSGNIGATNVMRVGGKKWLGILTAFLDGLKGYIPVMIARFIDLPELELAIVGCLSVIGHIFPLGNKFKGGKGVATFIGMNMALNIKIGVIMAISWGISFFPKKISSLASIVMVITAAIAHFYYSGFLQSIPIVLTSLLILFKHKKNVIGLLNGTEKSLKI